MDIPGRGVPDPAARDPEGVVASQFQSKPVAGALRAYGFSAAPTPVARGFGTESLLERKAQRELEVALRIGIEVRRRVYTAGIGVAGARHADLRVRIPQIHVVEKVDRFDAHLEQPGAAHPEMLENR